MEQQFLEVILALSGGFWALFWFILHLLIMRFIVSRYEKETNLGETLYFTEGIPIARYLPAFWSSGIYYFHFLTCLHLWKWRKKFKGSIFLRDIDNAEQVTGHFSKIETWLIHLDFISLIITGIHMFLYLCFYWENIF